MNENEAERVSEGVMDGSEEEGRVSEWVREREREDKIVFLQEGGEEEGTESEDKNGSVTLGTWQRQL